MTPQPPGFRAVDYSSGGGESTGSDCKPHKASAQKLAAHLHAANEEDDRRHERDDAERDCDQPDLPQRPLLRLYLGDLGEEPRWQCTWRGWRQRRATLTTWSYAIVIMQPSLRIVMMTSAMMGSVKDGACARSVGLGT